MTLCMLAIISILSIATGSAFAQDGADRTMQRTIDHQQAYLAAQQTSQRDAVAKTQPELNTSKAKASANCS